MTGLPYSFSPFKRAKFHVGAGLDDPRDKDLAVGGRTRNYVLWGNHTYDLSGNTTAGIECSYWSTRYSNSGSCPNLRVQMMMQYGF